MTNLLQRARDEGNPLVYEFRYKENGGAHNQTTWRNAAVEGLQFLFPE